MRKPVLLLLLLLAACGPDETVSGQTTPQAVWRLTHINEEPIGPRISIRFPSEGEVTGLGPCNGYSATQTAPLPWIDIGPIAVTRRACPDLALENRYLGLLEQAEFVEILGDTLLMRDGNGTELAFRLEQ